MSHLLDPAAWIALALAYLLGSVPWGLVLTRRRGVDVRRTGSGNIGATNVARAAGKKLGIAVLILDAVKGAAAALLLVWWVHRGPNQAPWLPMAGGLSAMVGHCFPVWLRFRGGKGVATALGVFLVVEPAAALAGLGCFVVVYGVFRVVSLASLAATLVIVAWMWAVQPSPIPAALASAAGILVILKHAPNIKRLLGQGELRV